MPLTATDLTSMLGRWDDQTGPLYGQLSRALRRLLEGGHLVSGATLPAERQLAKALSVSRNTVSAAYAALRSDGWIDARQGSATTVTASRHSAVGAFKANGLFATLLRDHPDVLDFTVAVPDAAPIVKEVMAHPDRFADELVAVTAHHGYFPRGYPPLREALAGVLTSNGFTTSPEQLMVTSGAQQAISLLVQATVRVGDAVVVEDVTFPGALDAIARHEGKLLPVPMGREGIDVDEFARRVRGEHPRLAYVIPTFHNPTGTVLDGAARRHLARVIAETGVTTVDDLTLAELDYGRVAPPPLAVLEPAAPIISIGSLSKVFWGGLRIGWLRAHPTVIDHLAGLKATSDMGTSAVAQAMAVAMLHRYEDTRAWRNRLLTRSLDAVVDAAQLMLPGWSWERPTGGPHLWLRIPDIDAVVFAHRALRRGLALVPGPLLAADDRAARDRIRIPLYRSPHQLRDAVRIMAEVWDAGSASG